MLIQLAIKSGLRISDILNLKVSDINKSMTIYEVKSRRERTFKIGKKLFNRIKNYCAGKFNSDFVFHSERKAGKHIHRSTIHRHIKKALRGLNFDCSAHSTRKLYAQNIFKKSRSVKKVQKSLNHRKIEYTATYLDIDINKIVKGAKP